MLTTPGIFQVLTSEAKRILQGERGGLLVPLCTEDCREFVISLLDQENLQRLFCLDHHCVPCCQNLDRLPWHLKNFQLLKLWYLQSTYHFNPGVKLLVLCILYLFAVKDWIQ